MNEMRPWGRGEESPETRREPFTFTGAAREYFGIWIVNVLLTIVTLGIYSAWAKVRRQRYFYGNTRLAGSSFDYHARPVQILIGRIIVLAVLIAYNIILTIFPIAGLPVIALFVLAVPWFVMRGLRFNARVTSFRNVRFNFTGGYWGAFRAYILAGLVAAVSLGILAPFASRWTWRYLMGNLRYGDRPVECDPKIGKLYRQWWLPALLTVAGLAIMALAVVAMWSSFVLLATEDSGDGEPPLGLVAAIYVVMIALFLVYGIAGLFYRAGVRNVAFNATVVDGRHRLVSALGRRRYAWIAITNFLATVLTLSLARPWAAVRMARYVASATALDVTGSLDDYLSEVKDTGSAVGAEYMDMEGFDVGF